MWDHIARPEDPQLRFRAAPFRAFTVKSYSIFFYIWSTTSQPESFMWSTVQLFSFLFLFSAKFFGQTTCPGEKLIGDWEYTNSFPYNGTFDMDSVFSHPFEASGFLTFISYKMNGTMTYTYRPDKESIVNSFTFQPDMCTIHVRNEAKPSEVTAYYILHLDDHHLVVKSRAFQGIYVLVYRRKKV